MELFLLIPLTANYFCMSAVIFYNNGFIHFGGFGYTDGGDLDLIARLDSQTYEWSKIGRLKQKRRKHNVILTQSDFLILGGQDRPFKTERCSYENKTISCSTQTPELSDYIFPILIPVSSSYCKEIYCSV